MSAPRLSLSVQRPSRAAGLPRRALIRRWIARALTRDAEIALRIVDEDEGRELNTRYRGKACATNVLAFVYDTEPVVVGDIVVAAPVVAREAREQGKDPEAHWAHLTVHGVLHLMGYEHQRARDAAKMEAVETRILGNLGYPDPYAGDE